MTTVYLEPITQGQSLKASLAPFGNHVTVFNKDYQYQVSFDSLQPYDRTFIVKSYEIFAALQAIVRHVQDPSEVRQAFARIASLYRNQLIECRQRLQQLDEPDVDVIIHVQNVFQIFSLAQLLFLSPASDALIQPVGEDLLHWINTCDPAPSREDGLSLAAMAQPWDSDLFWAYLPRCLLRGLFKAALTLMGSLKDHDIPFVRKAAKTTCRLLQGFPRTASYDTVDDYNRNCLLYRRSVKDVIRDLENDSDDDAEWIVVNSPASSKRRSSATPIDEDDRFEWLARFKSILNLLKGDEDAVLDQAEDWKEALAAWSLLVQPALTREELPDVIERVLDQLPPEDESVIDNAQIALVKGHTATAMQKCDTIDLWLATHLTDLLEKINVMESVPTLAMPFRQWFVLRYADQLSSDPGLWRIIVHYLYLSDNEQGLAQLKQILLRIPLKEQTSTPVAEASSAKPNGVHVNGRSDTPIPEEQETDTTAEDVLRACYDYGCPETANEICRSLADMYSSRREYGRAVAYIVQSGDTVRMERIVEALVDEYVLHGKDEFAKRVDTIPAKLLRPSLQTTIEDEEDHVEHSAVVTNYHMFAKQISFLAQYRDFHAFFAQGSRMEASKLVVGLLTSNVTPLRMVPILLLDAVPLLEDGETYFDGSETFELLRCLEAVSTYAPALGYLVPLGKILLPHEARQDRLQKAGEQQLKVVRLALARHLERCFVRPVAW